MLIRKLPSLVTFIALIVLIISFASLLSDILVYFLRKNDRDLNFEEEIHSDLKCECHANTRVKLAQFSVSNISKEYVMSVEKNGYHVKDYMLSDKEFQELQTTCDRFKSFRRGPNLKVFSYALDGSNTLDEKLVNLTQMVADKYPGWIMRFYYKQDTIDPSLICKIECAKKRDSDELLDNADFCNINKIPRGLKESWSTGDIDRMMWRLLPLGDTFVDVFSSRDTDSYILDREVASVNEWMGSGNLFHIMRGIFKHESLNHVSFG